MLEDLIKLRNTLNMIETRGNSTLVMAECMSFTDMLIAQARAEKNITIQPLEGDE